MKWFTDKDQAEKLALLDQDIDRIFDDVDELRAALVGISAKLDRSHAELQESLEKQIFATRMSVDSLKEVLDVLGNAGIFRRVEAVEEEIRRLDATDCPRDERFCAWEYLAEETNAEGHVKFSHCKTCGRDEKRITKG